MSKYESRHEMEKRYQKYAFEVTIPPITVRNCSKAIREIIEDFELTLRRIDPRIKVRRYLV